MSETARRAIRNIAEANIKFDNAVIEILKSREDDKPEPKRVNWAKEITYFAIAALVAYAFVWGILAL